MRGLLDLLTIKKPSSAGTLPLRALPLKKVIPKRCRASFRPAESLELRLLPTQTSALLQV